MLKLLLLQPEYQQRLVQAGLIKLPTDAISDLGNEVLISQVEYCNMNETHKAHIYCMCPDEQCSETFQKRFQGNHAFCSRPCTRKYHNRRGGTAGGGGVNSDVIDNPLSGCQNVPLKESGLYSESGACLLSGRLLPLYIGGPCENALLTSAKSQSLKDIERNSRVRKENPESECIYVCLSYAFFALTHIIDNMQIQILLHQNRRRRGGKRKNHRIVLRILLVITLLRHWKLSH